MTLDREKSACKQKRRFPNEAAAKDAVNKINPKKKLKAPSRAYKCPVCAGYHLTSAAKR